MKDESKAMRWHRKLRRSTYAEPSLVSTMLHGVYKEPWAAEELSHTQRRVAFQLPLNMVGFHVRKVQLGPLEDAQCNFHSILAQVLTS